MNTKLKLIAVAFFSLILSACASTPELNRELVQKEKISNVIVNQMDQNMNIDVADSSASSGAAGGLLGALVGGAIDSNINGKRRKSLAPMIENIESLNVNMVLKNALADSLELGSAFDEEVIITAASDESTQNSFLVPILTPNIIMQGDYSGVMVSLTASTVQDQEKKSGNRYQSVYISDQTLDSELLAKREENKQFWLDNHLLLREKIVDGLYNVAKQFADDYNSGLSE